ncbi:MAG: hypothetical protein LC792_16875 [Actinobacteria bacterium]|nr:hypothetical protein [Actinomycetota bacterium]
MGVDVERTAGGRRRPSGGSAGWAVLALALLLAVAVPPAHGDDGDLTSSPNSPPRPAQAVTTSATITSTSTTSTSISSTAGSSTTASSTTIVTVASTTTTTLATTAKPTVVDPVVNNTDKNLKATDRFGGAEPSIAVNPLDPRKIAISGFSGNWGDPAGGAKAPLWYTIDGGSTWTRELTIPIPPGRTDAALGCPCDQAIDYGRDGTLYGTFLLAKPDPQTGEGLPDSVVTGDTTDPADAAKWQWRDDPVQASDKAAPFRPDQPQLAVNRDPSTANQDDVYVAYDDVPDSDDAPATARVAASKGPKPPDFAQDSAVGSLRPQAASNPGLRLAGDPRTGIIYALWETVVGTTAPPKQVTLHVSSSTDGGATWSSTAPAAGSSVAPAAAGAAIGPFVQDMGAPYKFGSVNSLITAVDTITVDQSNGDVYLAFGQDTARNGAGN